MSGGTFPKVVHDFAKSNGVDTVFNTEGPSLTRQEFVEECDINTLMAKYDAHVIGGPGNMAPSEPMYADFTAMPSTLMEYMDVMHTAESNFMRLPAVVRKEFDNSAQMFYEFASDPENIDQLRTWGLAAPKPKDPESAAPAPVAPAPASVPAPAAQAPVK